MTSTRFPQGPLIDMTTGTLSLEWFMWLQNPQFVTINFDTAVDVPNGGTGASTFTAHGVLLGQGTDALVATAAMTNGQLLIGQTGADPEPHAVSGDATLNANGVFALSTTGVSAASYGGVASVATFTVDTRGRLTAASNAAIALDASAITSGALSTARGGTGNASLTFPSGAASMGYLNIPQNSQSADYTTIAADSGKHIYHPTTDNNARVFTIASNASVPYIIGTAITFVNDKNTLSIAIDTDTMVMAGGTSTGTRTLTTTGIATALKVDTTRWVISGTGLT